MPQGTIRTYNERSRSGLILDDSKRELAFDSDSFRTSGVREFRIGQRVRFDLTGDPDRPKVPGVVDQQVDGLDDGALPGGRGTCRGAAAAAHRR